MTKQEFLAFSLPYELKVYVKYTHNPDNSELETMIGLTDDSIITDRNEEDIAPLSVHNYGLCLHPLSDLTKPIEHKGDVFIPIERILQGSCFDTSKMTKEEIDSYADAILMTELMSLNDALLLAEWHFDIAGLIEKGEAIDVNTLLENPYK